MEPAESTHLPRWPFSLDTDKAVEAVLYVAARMQKPSLHSISKVLFHADKAHLSRYGRPISGDRYVAMKHGPVPSATYDILKAIRDRSGYPLPARAQGALEVQGYTVRPLRSADETVLSPSDVECLAESAKLHGAKPFGKLSAESHGAAWEAADENDDIVLENLLLEIDNRDELRQHFAGT